MINENTSRIMAAKKELGPITFFDCIHVDTVSAHRLLGQDAHKQIHKILKKRLDEQGSAEKAAAQIRQVRRYQAALDAKLQNPHLDETVKTAIANYSASLSAWADGAQLTDFRHAFLPAEVDGSLVRAKDLAMFLQEDETGCQTGVYREQDGSVIFWHVEEDEENSPGERFDKLRLFSFRAYDGKTATAFIYPDLLPGPTFAWQSGAFVPAIDTLHIKPADLDNSILPNTLAWLALYLGTYTTREKLVKSLGPFHGGYSLTALHKTDGQVDVEKIEYANDALYTSGLEENAGCYLFQTNILRDPSLPIGAHEKASDQSRALNGARYARTARFMKVIQSSRDALPLVFRMFCSQTGGEAAYANTSVKAYLVCRMAPTKTSIWVGGGAPIRDDELFTFEYPNL